MNDLSMSSVEAAGDLRMCGLYRCCDNEFVIGGVVEESSERSDTERLVRVLSCERLEGVSLL